MPPEIRLISEPSSSSQVRTIIETFFAALDSLKKARVERVNKYQKDSTEKLDLAAKELKATDAAHIVQKQKDLETLKNQFDADTAAFDYMKGKIAERLEDLSNSNTAAMIGVLDERLNRLQKIVDEADTKEKELNDEIKALKAMKRKLENRKAGQVAETTEPPQTTQQPQEQPAQARRRPRTRR